MTSDETTTPEVGHRVYLEVDGVFTDVAIADCGTRLWTVRLADGQTAYLEWPPGHDALIEPADTKEQQ